MSRNAFFRAEIDRLLAIAGECYRWTGADPDGDDDAHLAEHAVAAVRELRETTDAEIAKLESMIERLRADLAEAHLTIKALDRA